MNLTNTVRVASSVLLLVCCIGCETSAPNLQAEATAKLKLALDGWVFGDSLESLSKGHPDFAFDDVEMIGWKLLRYQIDSSRVVTGKDGNEVVEFSVTQFRTESIAGGPERKAQQTFRASKNPTSGKWTIIAVF